MVKKQEDDVVLDILLDLSKEEGISPSLVKAIYEIEKESEYLVEDEKERVKEIQRLIEEEIKKEV